MKYLKIFEEFKLKSVEKGFEEMDNIEIEIIKMKRKIDHLTKQYDILDKEIRDNNKLIQYIEGILNKLKLYIEKNPRNNKNILIYLDPITEDKFNNHNILFPDEKFGGGTVQDISWGNCSYNRNIEGWWLTLTSNIRYRLYDFSSKDLYMFLQYLMDDKIVLDILNSKKFKKMNESFSIKGVEDYIKKYNEMKQDLIQKRKALIDYENSIHDYSRKALSETKIDRYLDLILDKLLIEFYGSDDVYNKSILRDMDGKTEKNIQSIHFNFTTPNHDENFHGKINMIYKDRYDGWSVDLYDGSIHMVEELPIDGLYLILKYLMEDDLVIRLLNSDKFIKANK